MFVILQITMILKAIINKQSKIDILVNNAGTNIPEHFTKVKTKNMEHLVKINTIAAFNLAQLCSLKMIKSKNRKKIGGCYCKYVFSNGSCWRKNKKRI